MAKLINGELANVHKIGSSFKHNEGHSDSSVASKLFIICFVTFVASFDFGIFVFLSDNLSLTFFADFNDGISPQLKLVSLFALGFIARPIGALVLGRYADIKGRKPALHIGMALIFSTSIAAACLPTYAQAGVTASILVIIIRLLQGAAFANQVGLSWVYVAESLPTRKSGFFLSLICANFAIGAITSAIFVSLLNHLFSEDQIIAFAWRIPFVCSGLMGLIGWLLVRRLNETPLFLAEMAYPEWKPALTNFSHALGRFNSLLLTAFLSLIYASSMVMFLMQLPELLDRQVSIGNSTLHSIKIIGMISLAIGMLFYGWLADRLDLGRALMLGAIIMGINILVLYYYLSHGNGTYLLPIYVIVGLSNGFISLCPMVFLQLFPTRCRLTSINVTFNLITVFTGVILPFWLLYIIEVVSFAPAMYMMFIAVCAFFIGFYVYQTPHLHTYHHTANNLSREIKLAALDKSNKNSHSDPPFNY